MTATMSVVDRAVDDTCPTCDGAGEVYGDWRRDPLSGHDYAERVTTCATCGGTGVSPVEVVVCESCPAGSGRMLIDDDECPHGRILCVEHVEHCDLCVEDRRPVDDGWDPWADAS